MSSITVNTNISALIAQQNLSANQSKLQKTMARLSSGLRVTDAKDDPAGLAIAQNMNSSVRALRQGSRNGNDGVSLVQTAQGAMNQTLDILQRMREISAQASTGTYASGDLTNLNTEYQALLGEIDRVQATSTFNGINVLTAGSVSIQVGENNTSNDRITVNLTGTTAANLSVNSTSVTSASNAQSALSSIATAIGTVTTGLAKLGSAQSNLEAAISANDARATSLEQAKSRIMDADFAEESANLAKYMVLNQSNVAMLSQANSVPQMVLKLLG